MAANQDAQQVGDNQQVAESRNDFQKVEMSQYEMAMYCHLDYLLCEEYDENGAPID